MIYGLLAPYYDEFIEGIDYAAYADFIEKCFDRYLPARPELVLDLACGTGTLTRELASRGYDMTGVDASAQMLSVARDFPSFADKILYLEQDMRDFELYGTVGACVCTLDGINHLLKRDALCDCLSLVHNYLDPDGLFIFDIIGKGKFESELSSHTYVYEKQDDMCVWQSTYNRKTHFCDYYITLFKEGEDGRFARYDEWQREKMYTLSSMKRYLTASGFEVLGCVSDFDFTPASDENSRIYIIAKCKKDIKNG
ncbi:MAG: class I SAM-dependent methyltransferase [Clostridia bacterium]|nr:class I SAM-dependent methyltransferase [Clostridia bacterium]